MTCRATNLSYFIYCIGTVGLGFSNVHFNVFCLFVFQDEEAAESRQAKLFISTHNRQSEECAQLIKSILAGMKLTIRRRSVITIGHFNLVCLKVLSAYKLSKP